MKSQILIILGISSTLLGLYILLVSLLNLQEKADYHIGCYLSDKPNDKAFQFRTRLQQLKAKGDNSRNLHTTIRNQELVDPELHQKSVDLTKSVESYIQKLTLVKKYQEGNMEFFVQLSNARQSYEVCVNELRSNIDIDDSRSLWTQYQACFDKYQALKDNIDRLYSKRNKYLQEIDTLLVYDPNINPNFDFEAELRRIKERYDRQNVENDKNKEQFIADLKRIQHRNQSKSSQHDQSERQFNRAKLQYEICLKNLKEFKKCQDIAKALREYGYVEPVESLEDRIRSKRQILMQMRQLVLKSRQDGGNNQAITEMYAKREKQLLQTIKLRLHMGYDEMKECGCTEESRKKLQSEYQNAKMKLNLNKKQINDFTFEIYTLEKKIIQTDQLRERLINEFTQETERLRNRQTSNILTLKERLQLLKANITIVNQQINQYETKINSLQFECNQYKDRLSLKLKDSQTVTECFKNRDFYDQLKSKAQLILKKDDESSLMAKEKVRKDFWDITYPDNINLKPIISVANQLAEFSQTSFEDPAPQEPLQQRTLQKEVITTERDIKIQTPQEKVTIHQEQVVTIQHTLHNEL